MLPKRLWIATCTDILKLDSQLDALCQAGLDGIMLRDPRASGHLFQRAARRLFTLQVKYNILTSINDRLDIAIIHNIPALHLPQASFDLSEIRNAYPHLTLGRSIHSQEELSSALEEGLDYVLLSPIFPSSCKPKTLPLGIDNLTSIVKCSPVPVYALGGIDASNADSCLHAGAYGIAFMSALTQASCPLHFIHTLCQQETH